MERCLPYLLVYTRGWPSQLSTFSIQPDIRKARPPTSTGCLPGLPPRVLRHTGIARWGTAPYQAPGTASSIPLNGTFCSPLKGDRAQPGALTAHLTGTDSQVLLQPSLILGYRHVSTTGAPKILEVPTSICHSSFFHAPLQIMSPPPCNPES